MCSQIVCNCSSHVLCKLNEILVNSHTSIKFIYVIDVILHIMFYFEVFWSAFHTRQAQNFCFCCLFPLFILSRLWTHYCPSFVECSLGIIRASCSVIFVLLSHQNWKLFLFPNRHMKYSFCIFILWFWLFTIILIF